MRHCCLAGKDFLCMTMPSCPEAGQRAKLNRTCHRAQSSLLTFFQESLKSIFQESGINKKVNEKEKIKDLKRKIKRKLRVL